MFEAYAKITTNCKIFTQGLHGCLNTLAHSHPNSPPFRLGKEQSSWIRGYNPAIFEMLLRFCRSDLDSVYPPGKLKQKVKKENNSIGRDRTFSLKVYLGH